MDDTKQSSVNLFNGKIIFSDNDPSWSKRLLVLLAGIIILAILYSLKPSSTPALVIPKYISTLKLSRILPNTRGNLLLPAYA